MYLSACSAQLMTDMGLCILRTVPGSAQSTPLVNSEWCLISSFRARFLCL